MPNYVRWLVVVAALSWSVIVACGGSETSDTPSPAAQVASTPEPTATPTPTPTPTATATPTLGPSAQDILDASRVAMEEVSSYRFTIDAEVEATVGDLPAVLPVTFAGVYEAPDRILASLLVQVGQSGLSLDVRTISGTTYVGNRTTDQWVEVDQLRSVFPNPALLAAALRQQLGQDAEVEASFGAGADAHLLVLESLEMFGELEPHGRVSVWIDAEDFLVRRVEASGSVQFRELALLMGSYGIFNIASARVTMRLTAFDEPVSVGFPGQTRGPAPTGPGGRFPDQGTDHVQRGDLHPPYSSVPATSGPHYGSPLAPWGVHGVRIPDEVLVHNLEHGGIGVHYNCPDGCEELIAQLTGLVEAAVAQGQKVIMTPYLYMDTRIALTAWTFLDAFDEFDEERIRAFIRSHESSPNAPEPRVP